MGSAGKGGSSRADRLLTDTAREAFAEGKPLRNELLGQQLEALQTGGVGATAPIAGAAMSQSRAATARALAGLTEELSRSGLSRTPFAARQLAGTRLAGEQATELIPSQIAQAFIAGAPTSGFAGIAPGLSGLSNAAGVSAQRDIAKGNQTIEYIKAASQAGGAIAGAFACWIAARLFGDGSPEFSFARWWIFNAKWRGARVVRWAYLRWGRSLARSRVACAALRPAFEAAARRGAAELSRGL